MTILNTSILNTGLCGDIRLTIRNLFLLGLENVTKVLLYDFTIESYLGWVGKEGIDLI